MQRWGLTKTTVVGCLLASSLVAAPASGMPGCAAGSEGGDWPSLNHDLANSRNQPEEDRIDSGNASELAQRWSFTIPVGVGAIDGTPAIADGCVYVATNFRTLFALNADTGDLVWRVAMPASMWSSPAVADGKIFVHVNTLPRETIALDQATGEIVWRTPWDDQPGTWFMASPVVFDGMVFSALSAVRAEDELFGPDRRYVRGRYAILDADTGAILARTWTISDEDFAAGYAGAGLWATPAVDLETGYAYEGTGNTFTAVEHPHSNAILKIDVDPSRETFGEIVDYFHGTYDQYVDGVEDKPLCHTTSTPLGVEEFVYNLLTCFIFDLDFGASPQLFRDEHGRMLVGDHQKSGMYHAADADTMDRAWSAVVGGPWILGGAATASFDGEDGIYVAGNFGQLFALDKDAGGWRWAMPVIDTQTSGPPLTQHSQPATTANGVLYIIDGRGVFTAYDTATGGPLLARPLVSETGVQSASPGGGIAVARHQVYVASGRNLVVFGLPAEA